MAAPETSVEPVPPLVPADEPAPTPTTRKPVIVSTATPLHASFTVPAPLDDNGAPVGDPIVITHAGTALSKKDAAAVLDAARHAGVALIDVIEKD